MLLERLLTRTTNRFGRSDEERAAVVRDHTEVEPILRARATHVLDTTAPVAGTLAALETIVSR